MHRTPLLVAATFVSMLARPALAQPVIAPYGDSPAAQAQPTPSVLPPPPLMAPPVPPPIVVPPPGYGYEGQPMSFQLQPPGYREVEEPRYGLMIAGLVVLGASWSINAASAYFANEWKLAVPVVGPFLETQNVNTAPGHEYNRALVGLLVFDGLIETAGAVMLFAGALTHHLVRVYDRPARVSFVPTAGRGGAGVAAFGHF